jgi:hypothetical protein
MWRERRDSSAAGALHRLACTLLSHRPHQIDRTNRSQSQLKDEETADGDETVQGCHQAGCP